MIQAGLFFLPRMVTARIMRVAARPDYAAAFARRDATRAPRPPRRRANVPVDLLAHLDQRRIEGLLHAG